MAKRPGPDDGTQPTVPLDASGKEQRQQEEEEEEEDDVSLEEILRLYSQPINEEQAWAVCYQTCRGLALHHHRRRRRHRHHHHRRDSSGPRPRRLRGPADLRVRRDGTLELRGDDGDGDAGSDKHASAPTSLQVIDSLGVMIYKALDFGLKESEERELSAPLERLIDLMTNTEASESDGCPDEGYEATEEEEEEEEEEGPEPGSASTSTAITNIRGYRDVIMLCSSHLRRPSEAPAHYQAVCRALYAEARELRTFLQKIKNAKENLRRMEGEETAEPAPDLNQLQNADWARFWVQVMRDLRDGVKLKKVHERHYDPLPIEFQLTPYEMLMDDIRSKRYTLRKVMVNGDVPPRLKKSAHEVILEFIRSRPPLNPVGARKLKPHPPRPPSLHERLLEDIKAERKLRPVSPDMIRRSRLGAGKSISTPQDLFRGSDTPDAPRKLAVSTQSLADSQSGGVPLAQRKRLLRAPTLAELDSSESEEEVTRSSSSTSVPLMDTSSDAGRKAPPNFLPSAPQRRHSMERASPGGVRPFAPPPSRQSSKSLLVDPNSKEEFCNPLEVLALTVDEVMHIRQVLVKAELEKFQQYKEVYSALKKGKLCFSCRIKRFSLFTWSYTCQFCKRPVCSQCSTKMRLPSKPYATLPIYSLGGGSGSMSRDEGCVEAERQPFGSGAVRHSLRRSVSRASRGREARQEELLPAALTEDWVSMEVCVDCKKFISDIISSSKRSLSVASKRVRRNRKTQSFYLASSASVNFRPSERPINEL